MFEKRTTKVFLASCTTRIFLCFLWFSLMALMVCSTMTTAAFFTCFGRSACAVARRRTLSISLLNTEGRTVPWKTPLFAGTRLRRDYARMFSSTAASAQLSQRADDDDEEEEEKMTSLTRTMVRRMKVQDLREQLEGCGIDGISKQNRTQLIELLLDRIDTKSKRKDSMMKGRGRRKTVVQTQPQQDATKVVKSTAIEKEEEPTVADNATTHITDATKSYSSSATEDETNVSEDTTTKNKKTDRETQPDESDDSSDYLDMAEMDPSRTYILRPTCLTADKESDESPYNGSSGVGMILRDVEHDQVVWTSHFYFPAKRTLYEASYTALVCALRCAVHWLKLPNLRIQIDQSIVVHQMIGIYPVEKESLKPMHKEALKLKEDLGQNCSLELIPRLQLAESEELAREALENKVSMEFFDEMVFSSDLSPLSTDPMGEDYTGSAKATDSISDPPELVANNLFAPQDEDDAIAGTKSQTAGDSSSSSPEPVTIDPSKKYILMFDGGSRGNPGKAGVGMALFDETGDKEIWSGYKYLGDKKFSNNQAEYYSFILGLQCALSLGVKRVECRGDSELIIKQLKKEYQVKNEGLKKLFGLSRKVINKFELCEFVHVKREDNKRADSLANTAMDEEKSFGFEEVG